MPPRATLGGQRLPPRRSRAVPRKGLPGSECSSAPPPLPRASPSQLPFNFQRLAAQLCAISASPAGRAALTRMHVGLNMEGIDSSFSLHAAERQTLVFLHAATLVPTLLLAPCCCPPPATPTPGNYSFGAKAVQSIRKITLQPQNPAWPVELELPRGSGFGFSSAPG